MLSSSLILFAGSRAAGAAPVRLTVDASSLSVTGITARGSAVLFGITREVDPEDDVPTIHRSLTVLKDDDGDGTVTQDLGAPVPLRSMWVAVDLASGDFDAAAPKGFRLKRVNWRGNGITSRADGRDAVEDVRSFAEVLVVRPGAGGWTLRLGDGGPSDADGIADGRLTAALDAMEPLPGSPAPPERFQRGDTVLLLDPNAMEMTLVKVGEAQ
jgi:hypothetical protein